MQAASSAKILAAGLRVLHDSSRPRPEELTTAIHDPRARQPAEEGRPRGAERRFFLAERPAGARARLLPEEERHAVRVLRLGRGAELLGLDGQGGVWPLRIAGADRRGLELELLGPPSSEPPAGDPRAPLPWIEVALALPRASRAEDLIDRLVQLGVSAFTPLVCERSQGGARELLPARLARLERAGREACKQSRRSWLPVWNPPRRLGGAPPEAFAPGAGRLAVLAPQAPLRLLERALEWRASGAWFAREQPLVLAVGPEGGFTEQELRDLRKAGGEELCLGPHVLRIETAAEAAAALVAQVFFDPGRAQKAMRSRSET